MVLGTPMQGIHTYENIMLMLLYVLKKTLFIWGLAVV